MHPASAVVTSAAAQGRCRTLPPPPTPSDGGQLGSRAQASTPKALILGHMELSLAGLTLPRRRGEMAGGLLVSTQQILVISAAPGGEELQLVDAWPSVPVLIL